MFSMMDSHKNVQLLYPDLTELKQLYFGEVEVEDSNKSLSEGSRSLDHASRSSLGIPSEVLWPRNGDNLRIASRLSRERDGFLRVKKDNSRNPLLVDAKGSMDKTNSLFKVFHLPSMTRSFSARDEMWVLIGIPGERVDRSANKVFLLKTAIKDGKKTIVAKSYDKPSTDLLPIIPTDDLSSLQFLLEYEGGGNFAIRDTDTWMDDDFTTRYYYIKVNGDGKITRVKRNRHVDRDEYSNPGMQFSLVHLGSDDDLIDGE